MCSKFPPFILLLLVLSPGLHGQETKSNKTQQNAKAPQGRKLITDFKAEGSAKTPRLKFAQTGWLPSTKVSLSLQAVSDKWFSNPVLASNRLQELRNGQIGSVPDLLEATIASVVLRELGKPIDHEFVMRLVRKWNERDKLDYVEYRWATYLHCIFLPGSYLLAPLKRLDDAVPDNYLTQTHIILMSGARTEDIEFGLALGKNYAKRWASYSAAQVCYATILWDKARKTKRATDFDVAINQMEKAKKCPDCDSAYRKVIDLWIGNIQFTKKRDVKQ